MCRRCDRAALEERPATRDRAARQENKRWPTHRGPTRRPAPEESFSLRSNGGAGRRSHAGVGNHRFEDRGERACQRVDLLTNFLRWNVFITSRRLEHARVDIGFDIAHLSNYARRLHTFYVA